MNGLVYNFFTSIILFFSEKYIGENGYPITISSEEQEKIRKEWNSPVSIRLPVSLMEEGFSIIQNFHEVDAVLCSFSMK